MRKANISEVPEMYWSSPSGKFSGYGKILTEAVGGDSSSTDLAKRHPFEVELARLSPKGINCPYHSHTTQWEFYIIVSGTGQIRDATGITEAGPGDFFVFGPGETHQIINGSAEVDLIFYIIADNPLGDHAYFPDSDKWMVGIPGKRKVVKGREVDYLHGEDDANSPKSES